MIRRKHQLLLIYCQKKTLLMRAALDNMLGQTISHWLYLDWLWWEQTVHCLVKEKIETNIKNIYMLLDRNMRCVL